MKTENDGRNDFDFLIGAWKVHHRTLKRRLHASTEWVEFDGDMASRTLPHSDKLHVVERFTLNPTTLELTRDIVAEDPVYFADKYVDSDSVLPADAPFKVEACKELAPEYQQTGRK